MVFSVKGQTGVTTLVGPVLSYARKPVSQSSCSPGNIKKPRGNFRQLIRLDPLLQHHLVMGITAKVEPPGL